MPRPTTPKEKLNFDKLQSQGEADLQRVDFLKFQLEEIARVEPVAGEDEVLKLNTDA